MNTDLVRNPAEAHVRRVTGGTSYCILVRRIASFEEDTVCDTEVPHDGYDLVRVGINSRELEAKAISQTGIDDEAVCHTILNAIQRLNGRQCVGRAVQYGHLDIPDDGIDQHAIPPLFHVYTHNAYDHVTRLWGYSDVTRGGVDRNVPAGTEWLSRRISCSVSYLSTSVGEAGTE